MRTVKECIKLVTSKSGSMLNSGDIDQLNLLQSFFRELEASSREEFQEILMPQASEMVRKLQLGEPLTAAEKKNIEILIVGDADYYTKIENNFQDWIEEFNRLLSELQEFSGGKLNAEQLCHVRALARDALNLLPSIVYYISARARVEKFRSVLAGRLELEDKMMLASIIKTALESELQ